MKSKRLMMVATSIAASIGLMVSSAGAASADSTGTITFETPTYAVGNINVQNGWSNTGSYDSNVAVVSTFSNQALSMFGEQALQLSNSQTSGSFGDQTFSPGVDPAGSSMDAKTFDASFQIGTTTTAEQTGLSMSVSPDQGDGGRMSYLRLVDQADGVHVFFDDFRGTNFKEKDIATLSRTSVHTVRFLIDFRTVSSQKAVTVFIDGTKLITGATWEGYYVKGGESVPTVSKMLFRESGTAVSANAGQGFLVDNLKLSSY